MEAEDLRINNWVCVDSERIEKVVEVSKWDRQTCVSIPDAYGCSTEDYYGINRLSGIPLTEEILLKAWFENVGGWLEFGKISISFDDKRCVMEDEGGDSWSKLPYPKYVHTLQNLYFALTNTELEIQL